MDTNDKILLLLGEIRGELTHIRKLSERVSVLEQMQGWLKGGFAILLTAFAYMCRGLYGK
jgi:hypothetical protein